MVQASRLARAKRGLIGAVQQAGTAEWTPDHAPLDEDRNKTDRSGETGSLRLNDRQRNI